MTIDRVRNALSGHNILNNFSFSLFFFVCSEIAMVEPELINIKKIGHDLDQAIPNGLTDIFVTAKKRWCMQHLQDRDSYKLKQFGANKRTVEQGHK